MNTPTDGLETFDISRGSGAVVSIVVVRLAFADLLRDSPRDGRDDSLEVELEDLGIDVDGIGVKQNGIIERRKDGRG